LLIQVDQVPSLGYMTGSLSSQPATIESAARAEPAESNQPSYTLSNGLVTVTIDEESNWGISSILDAAGVEQLAESAIGNQLVFYQDGGNLYQFGNECGGSADFTPVAATMTTSGAGLGAVVLESGPLRV